MTLVSVRWWALRTALMTAAFPMWLAIGGVAWAFLFGLAFSWSLDAGTAGTLRYTGTLLQLGGLLTVAAGLREQRKLFPGLSGIGQRFLGWGRGLVAAFRRPRPVTLQADAAGTLTLTGKARLRIGAGPNATLEHRLDLLEQELRAIEQELNGELQELAGKVGGLKSELDRERAERTRTDDETAKLIQSVTVGGLNLSLVGLWWIGLSAVLGNGISDELAKALVLVGVRLL